jgi:hypothetical protein
MGQPAPGGSTHPAPSFQPIPGHEGAAGFPEGHDPATVVLPPRTDYDYSPLDLAPPGQRRRRQLIAGAIGALSVLLIGALIVFGWMLLRDDTPTDDENRVAMATQQANDAAATEAAIEANTDDGTPPPTPEPTEAAGPTAPAPTAAPTNPPDTSAPTDVEGLTALMPDAAILPAGFSAGTDSTLAIEDVVVALGGSRIAEQNLANWGWTGNVQRVFENPAPTASATSSITVSAHGFKDAASAAEALPFYSDVLAANGYYDVEAPAVGDSARMLRQDQEDGGVLVALYVQEGPVLYRVGGYALGGDPTADVVSVTQQMLADE